MKKQEDYFIGLDIGTNSAGVKIRKTEHAVKVNLDVL